MKILTKALGLLTITFSLFVTVSSVSASTTNQIQPASSLVVQDELQVLGTTRTYSIRIGAQGYGGVTFFNGTIINETTDADTGAEMPVTFGDDVRIDGELFRTEIGGDDPIKLSDTIRPQITNTYDLGTVSNTFRNVRATNLFGGSATITSTLAVGSSATIADELTVADYIAVGGGYGSTGSTLDSSGNGQFNGALTVGSGISTSTGTFSGDITANGDIIQSPTKHGTIKAQVFVQEDGDCETYASAYNWTYDDSPIICTLDAEGQYTLTFGFDAANNVAIATAFGVSDRFATVSPDLTNSRKYNVYTFDNSSGIADNANFFLVIF